MRIYGRDGAWYVIPEVAGWKKNTMLEGMEGRQIFGKPIQVATTSGGQYCVLVSTDFEQACRVGSYLDMLASICATEVQ